MKISFNVSLVFALLLKPICKLLPGQIVGFSPDFDVHYEAVWYSPVPEKYRHDPAERPVAKLPTRYRFTA